MNFEEYTEIEALNWSSLKNMHASPLVYHYRKQRPWPDSPAFALGRLVHTAILEPEDLAGRYVAVAGRIPANWRETHKRLNDHVIYPGKVRRGKAWDAFQADHDQPILTAPEHERIVGMAALVGDREVVTEEQLQIATSMARAVRTHEAAGQVFTGGRAEETVQWQDTKTGIPCKGRLDYVTPVRLVDLKTTATIEPRRFSRAAADFLYHGQLAYYHDGAIEAGVLPKDAENPMLVAVQKSEPYDVVVYRLTDQVLDAGRTLYRSLLDRLHDCQNVNWFPGLAPAPVTLDLPQWAAGMNGFAEEEW